MSEKLSREEWVHIAKTFPLGKITESIEDFEKFLEQNPLYVTHATPFGFSRPDHVDEEGYLWRKSGGYNQDDIYSEQVFKTVKLTPEQIQQFKESRFNKQKTKR